MKSLVVDLANGNTVTYPGSYSFEFDKGLWCIYDENDDLVACFFQSQVKKEGIGYVK